MILRENIMDEAKGYLTYDLKDGRRVKVEADAVRQYGLKWVMDAYGVTPPAGWDAMLPVYQSDRQVGSLPASFEPRAARSLSPLYDIRPGDFKRDGDRWIAAPSIGPGDFDCVPGFTTCRFASKD